MLVVVEGEAAGESPRFSDLSIGDAFTFLGTIYIKIPFICTVHSDDKLGDGNANAVRLRDGYLKKIDTCAKICPKPHAKVTY